MSETPAKKVEEKPDKEEEGDELPPPKPNGLNDYGKPLIVTIPPPFADLARRFINCGSFSRRLLNGNRKQKHCSPHGKHFKKHRDQAKDQFFNKKAHNCFHETENNEEVFDEIKDLQETKKQVETNNAKQEKADKEILIEDEVEARVEDQSPAVEEDDELGKLMSFFKNTTKGVEMKDGKLVVDFKELKQRFKGKAEKLEQSFKNKFNKNKEEKKFDKTETERRQLPPWLRVGEFVEKMEKMKNDAAVTDEDWKKFFTEEMQQAFSRKQFGPKGHKGPRGFGPKHGKGPKGFGFHNAERMSQRKGKQFGQFIKGLAEAFNVDLNLNYGSESETEAETPKKTAKNTKEPQQSNSSNNEKYVFIDLDLDSGTAKVLNQTEETEKENNVKVETEENVVNEAENEETQETGLSQEDILKMIIDSTKVKKKNDKKE